MNMYFISSGGFTDAGGFAIVNGKIVRIPGWNPEAMHDLVHAVNVITEAAHFKTPGLREVAMKQVMEFAQKEFAEHIKGGGFW